MSQKIKIFKNINFTPSELREFKSENFSIQSNRILNRHSYSVSCLNNLNKVNSKFSLLTKNPTENYLYSKINLDNLSKAKSLMDKSINNLSNSTNQMSVYNSLNYNSSSLEQIKTNNLIRKGKYHNLFNDNCIKNKNETFYSNDKNKNLIPLKYPKLLNNNMSARNQFCDRYKENMKNNNLNTVTIYIENKIGKNDKYKRMNKYKTKNNILIKDSNLLDKIVLIQSFWRSYFLRKLVVGGLEKYYSSIAVGKYLGKIIIRNKKRLFKIFVDSLKKYISNKRVTLFSYRKSKNKIKRYVKNNDDYNGSFGIPKDKVKDCIYFFIEKEQIKTNNKYKSNKNHLLNATDYNWNNNKKLQKKNNVKIVSLYNKSMNKVKRENSNKNLRVKVNCFNKKDNNYNKRWCFNNNNANYSKHINKNRNKKLTIEKPKKIYVRKKVRENSNNNISNFFSSEFSSIPLNENNIETIKESNNKILNSLFYTIRRKYLNIFYPFLIEQLIKIKHNNLSNKISIIRKRKNNSLVSNPQQKKIANIYSKVKSKSKTIYKSPKIKVNKNNQIEKNRKLKALKIIVEKKSNLIDKYKVISLTKYFLIWNKYNFMKKISSPSLQVHLSENFTRLNHKKAFSNDKRSENTTPKKYIKIKFRKTFSSPGTLGPNSDRKHISSSSCKKMNVIKKYSCFINNINCKRNLLIQINKKENKFSNKILSVIQKIELKNILFKHFHHWKKK